MFGVDPIPLFFYTQQLKKPVHVNMAQLILITSLPELSLGLGYLVISGEDGLMNPASLVCAFSYRLFLFFFSSSFLGSKDVSTALRAFLRCQNWTLRTGSVL